MSSQDKAVVPAQEYKLSMDRADIVVVGNGIAGLTAAIEARRLAPEKRIVIVTEQVHPTINTPALKQFAVAKLEREQLLAYPAGTERRERIHVVNARVEAIHANSKYVTLSGKRAFGYGSLLLATGGNPMGIDEKVPGRNFDGVLTLHRLQDYLDLRRRLPEISEAIVVGGGVHAIETVMGLLYWGIRTHWLIRSSIMKGMLDDGAADMVLESVRKAGAIVHSGTEVAGIVGRIGSIAGVITNHQELIPSQLLLTCTGTTAVTSLATQCSASMKHDKKGIYVDDQLRTSVRDVYAAGDVASLKNPQTGKYEPRAVWYAAVSQGRIAGAMLAGYDQLGQQPFGVPWHATHVGELSMLTVGSPLLEGNEVMTLTDKSQGNYRRLSIVDDRLVGYLALGNGTQPDSLAIKRIIDEKRSIRRVTKALLKGDFDARQYLSQMGSRAAQGIITTGKLSDSHVPLPDPVSLLPLPEPTQALQPGPAAESMPGIPALPAASASKSRQIEAPRSSRREIPETEPLQRPEKTVRREEQKMIWEEEVSAFSGNLPRISAEEVRTYKSRAASPQPEERFTEEISPFTGNLPALNSTDEESDPFTGNRSRSRPHALVREVESTLIPVPSSDWEPQGRQSSSYKEQKPSRSQEQRRGEAQEQAPSQSSRGLLSYARKENIKRVERRR
jgi:NADPH-dependent 2,4-dienoyl-CoA reductase/sulfur reductase-like enzyme